MTEEGTTFPTRCDYCGAHLEAGIRYPTLTVDGEDESLSIFTFCDEECKRAWGNEREG